MRRRLAFAAVLASAAGYLLRSEAERRLSRLRDRRRVRVRHGRVLIADIPHRYAPEACWPGTCWCGRTAGHLVHGSGR